MCQIESDISSHGVPLRKWRQTPLILNKNYVYTSVTGRSHNQLRVTNSKNLQIATVPMRGFDVYNAVTLSL
jgi:hypothetical protein